MSAPLVWLPFDPAELGDPPDTLRYEVVDPTEQVPDTVGEVRFYVPPYQVGSRVGEVLPRMTGLEVVQTLTAGVDNLRGLVPPGVTLCNGRGIHDTSTAELALTLILSSLRGIPDFVRAQDRHEWAPGWRPALADKQVLIVGYGAIGQAIEARLLAFEVDVRRSPAPPAATCEASTSCRRCCPTPTSWCSSCRSPTPRAAWSTRASWPR